MYTHGFGAFVLVVSFYLVLRFWFLIEPVPAISVSCFFVWIFYSVFITATAENRDLEEELENFNGEDEAVDLV